MKIAIVDGDNIAYALGWVLKDVPFEDHAKVVEAVNAHVYNLMQKTSSTHVIGFLGGSQPTFRDIASGSSQIFDTGMKGYKESRGGLIKPEWYIKHSYLITHILKNKFGFKTVEFIEADDAVIITAAYYQASVVPFVICHVDKDLNQFPGEHYNYTKDNLYQVSIRESEHNFWKQMIMGDSVDDIEGIPGYGEVKAEKYLSSVTAINFDYREIVLNLYEAAFGIRTGILRFALTYNYLRLLREPKYQFDIKTITPVEVTLPTPQDSEKNIEQIKQLFNVN